MEAIGQDRAKDTGEKDIEEIEERADAGDRDDRAMRRRNRQPIEPRSNSRARSGRFAYVVSGFSRTLIQPSHLKQRPEEFVDDKPGTAARARENPTFGIDA